MKDFSKYSLHQDLIRSLPESLKESVAIARSFGMAFESHAGQFRDGRNHHSTPIPYIVHPVGVAKLAIRFWVDGELDDTLETIVCTALLHDVLEDTAVQDSEIAREISPRCAELVLLLTKPEVNQTRDRRVRNEQFILQIKKGGNATIYLKICDSIHNLSRPTLMPRSLLRKTIEKAKGPYRGLLSDTPFEQRLNAALSAQLSSAEDALELPESQEENESHAIYLHHFLENLIERTKGKELEAHDVADILSKLPGVQKCAIGMLQANVSACISGHGKYISPELINSVSAEIEANGFAHVGDSSRFLGANTDKETADLFGCTFSGSASWVCLAVDIKKVPQWFCYPALKSIVALLSDKIIKRQTDEIFGLTARIWEQLSLDPRTLVGEVLDRQAIARLVDATEAAEFVSSVLRRGLNSLIKTYKYGYQIDRVEGRVKTLGSIIRKLRDRSITLESVDDIVGLRVIIVSTFAKNHFANLLRAVLLAGKGSSFCVLPIDADSIVLDEVSSHLGYTAKHLRLTAQLPNQSLGRVNCEIQIRTVQEDAWARISESLAYKNRSLSKKKSKHLLEQLSQLRDQADRKIDELQIG